VARKSRSGRYLCKDEAVPMIDAIRVYTWNAAYLEGTEDTKGSIEVNKIADFVVLDKDIMTCPHDEILKTNVLMTIINGEIVYGKSN
jgi:predicted amidohydrolase YtcJ